ncbi:MAG: FG-GAP repeat domain-containing protein [Rariglobus sp.]|nr:VCBS repeat-containing protein [Rariglobus sp.]
MNTRLFAIFCLALTAARAAAPDVVLAGPEVQKLDWNTRMLQAADVNGDGLKDVLVANNDRGTIDILFQLKPGEARAAAAKTTRANRWEPVVEDARFRTERVTTGVAMYDLVSGDLNGDGRVDLVYTGDPQALTVQYQQEDGTWTETRLNESPVPSQGAVTLRIGDLNGDKRNDLVMLGQKELAIFYQTDAGELAPPQRFPLADEACYGLELYDLNGDGRTDIVYLSNGRRDNLRVRLQDSQAQFGPEQAYPIKESRSTLQLLAAADAAKKTPARLVFAQQRTGQLEFFNFEPAKNKKNDSAPALRPRVFTPRAAGKTPAAYAFGDFNGDGREDIAVGDADGAQVFVYFRQPDGGFTVAEKFPSFADVRSLAAIDWTGKGRADLVVASLKEQSVGIASVNASGRLDYPQPLPGTGRPLAVAAGTVTDKNTPALVVLREEKGKRWFDVITRVGDAAPAITGTVALAGLKTDPRGLRVIDVNQDGLPDVAVFTPLDSMRVFLQAKDGTFADASTAAGFRKGLVDNLEVNALSSGDVTGDGKPEVLVSAGGFARALRLDATGELTVVDQFNARDTAAEISTAFVLPDGKTKRAEVVLYDRKGEQFQILRANKQGVYEAVDAIPTGRIDVVGSEVRGTGAQAEVFLLGKDRFWWLPLGRGDFTTRSVDSYTTDLPDINYGDVLAGDLTGDGKAELITLDPENSVVEILARDEAAKTWVSRMHFKVFETDDHFQGRRGESQEPREAIVADVTGDGKNDLLLLVHDRVLIYPQQ